MGVGAGLYMCDVVVNSSRSLSHLLMSSCIHNLLSDLAHRHTHTADRLHYAAAEAHARVNCVLVLYAVSSFITGFR